MSEQQLESQHGVSVCVCVCQLSGCLVMPRSPSTRRHSIGGRRHFSKGALVSMSAQDERLLPDELRSTEFRQLVEGAH